MRGQQNKKGSKGSKGKGRSLRNRVMRNNIVRSVAKAMQSEEEKELLNSSDMSIVNISIIGKKSSVSEDNTDAPSQNGTNSQSTDESEQSLRLELSPERKVSFEFSHHSTPRRLDEVNEGFEQSMEEGKSDAGENGEKQEDGEDTDEKELSFYRYLDAQKRKIKIESEQAKEELEQKVENISGKRHEFENKMLKSPKSIMEADIEKANNSKSNIDKGQSSSKLQFENKIYDSPQNVTFKSVLDKTEESHENEESCEEIKDNDSSFYKYLEAQKKKMKDEAEEAKRKLEEKVENLGKRSEKTKQITESNLHLKIQEKESQEINDSPRNQSLCSNKKSNKRKIEEDEPSEDAEARDLSFYRYLGAQEKKARQGEFDLSTAEDIGAKVDESNGMLSLSMFNVSNLFEASEPKPENVKEERVAVRGMMKSKSMAKIMKMGSAVGSAIWGIPYTNVVEDADTTIASIVPQTSKLDESPETFDCEGCSTQDKKSGKCVIS